MTRTALGMAMVRAGESAREDRLFDDPYAQRFLDAAPGAFADRSASTEGSLGAVFAMPTMDRYTALWKGGLGGEAPDWLQRHGWRPRIHDRAELAASHGRPAPDPSSGGFLTAVRLG